MEKYKKPSVKKIKTISVNCSLKQTNCNGSNSRQMPNTRFTK